MKSNIKSIIEALPKEQLTALSDAQSNLLAQLEESTYSHFSEDKSYTSSMGYWQACTDCCVLAGCGADSILVAKTKGMHRAGVD